MRADNDSTQQGVFNHNRRYVMAKGKSKPAKEKKKPKKGK
jgi:hypothetical protein